MHFRLNSTARSSFWIGLVLMGAVGVGASTLSAGRMAPRHSYAAVKAIVDAHCVVCHNDAQHPEKVNLSSYEKLMKSGDKHPTVTPGHPEKSNLYLYTDGQKQPRMPLKRPPLSKKDIATIRDWIKAGAKP